MRSGLRAVDHYERANSTSHGAQLGDGIDRAERVRHMIERDNPRPGVDERRELIEVDATIGGQSADAERCPDITSQLLPRDEVRMMLEARDDDLVTRANVRATPRRRDQVERLRRSPCEDEARRVPDADELR